jgi:hypothetical protein
VLSFPDEVLQKVALILGKKEILGLLDNLSQIGHEVLAFGRKL